jgi:hypothetical protein
MNPFSKPQENANTNQPDLAFQGEALEPQDENQTSTKKSSSTSLEHSKRKLPLPIILVAGIIILITILAFGLIAYIMIGQNNTQEITSYEECVAAGYPIMESYPEQCSANGQTFTRELTTDEIEKLNPGIYEDDELSFEYPTETFALAHLVCGNNSASPQLVDKSSNNKYSNVGCVHGIKFDIDKVDKVNELLDDPSCYSINKEQITIDNKPATSYTTEFIGGDVDKCTEGLMGKYSLKERYIYVENYGQLYLIWWPIHEDIDQFEYSQILHTFKFTDSEFISDNSNKTKPNINPYIDTEYGFSINFPSDWYPIEDSSDVFISNQNVQDPLEMNSDGIWVSIYSPAMDEFYKKLFNLNTGNELDGYKSVATKLSKNFEVDGYKALKYSSEPPPGWEGEVTYTYNILVNKNEDLINIGFTTFKRDDGQRNIELYDQIISTLKFTE